MPLGFPLAPIRADPCGGCYAAPRAGQSQLPGDAPEDARASQVPQVAAHCCRNESLSWSAQKDLRVSQYPSPCCRSSSFSHSGAAAPANKGAQLAEASASASSCSAKLEPRAVCNIRVVRSTVVPATNSISPANFPLGLWQRRIQLQL